MNFLANENIPRQSIILIRNAEHVVYSILEESPGVSDMNVLKHAITEKWIICNYSGG